MCLGPRGRRQYFLPVICISNRDERRQLRVAYNSLFRKIFHYRWSESVTALQSFLGRPTWEQLVEKRRQGVPPTFLKSAELRNPWTHCITFTLLCKHSSSNAISLYGFPAPAAGWKRLRAALLQHIFYVQLRVSCRLLLLMGIVEKRLSRWVVL